MTVNTPLVDIVVPIFNHPDLVEECIGRMESTTSVTYKLILVDDASTDPKMRPYLSTKRGVRVDRNFQNQGFGATCNKGARGGYSKYIVFLNSDCTPLPGWLDLLVEAAEKDPKLGVAGSLLLFHPESPSGPGGMVQHAGMCFDVHRRPQHRFIAWPPDHPKVREYRDDLQAVTGACLLTRRSLWNDIGGFWKGYGKGTFEDVELCLQAKVRGKNICYVPDSMLYHRVGASTDPDVGFPIQQNYITYMNRIGGVVKFDQWRVL